MPHPIEVRLRIPNSKHRVRDENGYPIDHASIRFRKTLDVETVPKIGDAISLPTASGQTLPATVAGRDWNEELGLFVVACQYANRSLTEQDFTALLNDPDWRMTPLI
jgi:hypothetical protein